MRGVKEEPGFAWSVAEVHACLRAVAGPANLGVLRRMSVTLSCGRAGRRCWLWLVCTFLRAMLGIFFAIIFRVVARSIPCLWRPRLDICEVTV